MHSQQPPGVVQNWSTLQCSKHDIEQCGYDHAHVTRGRMQTQFPLPHGPGLHDDDHALVTRGRMRAQYPLPYGPGLQFTPVKLLRSMCVVCVLTLSGWSVIPLPREVRRKPAFVYVDAALDGGGCTGWDFFRWSLVRGPRCPLSNRQTNSARRRVRFCGV